ncbi:helix-turn-helix transcriptional regulator [Rhizobium sp. GR12]
MAKKINLLDMAKIAGFSSSHFTNAFRQSTGQAPRELS